MTMSMNYYTFNILLTYTVCPTFKLGLLATIKVFMNTFLCFSACWVCDFGPDTCRQHLNNISARSCQLLSARSWVLCCAVKYTDQNRPKKRVSQLKIDIWGLGRCWRVVSLSSFLYFIINFGRMLHSNSQLERMKWVKDNWSTPKKKQGSFCWLVGHTTLCFVFRQCFIYFSDKIFRYLSTLSQQTAWTWIRTLHVVFIVWCAYAALCGNVIHLF